MRRCLIIFVSLLCSLALHAQHDVDFNIQAGICIGTSVALENTSDPATSFEWDFCPTQLEGDYTGTLHGTIAGSLTNISMVDDNGQWYGFAVARTNQLYKLQFGTDPHNPPVVTALGNPSSLFANPEGIDIVKEGANWYGLVVLLSGEVIRLSWGASLGNTPTGESLGLQPHNKLSSPADIEIVKDESDYFAVVANGSGSVTTIDFGSSLTTNPVSAGMIQSPVFPGATNLYGVTAIQQCGNWFLFAISDGKLWKVNAGSQLSSTITAGQITEHSGDLPVTIGSFNHIAAAQKGGDIYVYFTSYLNKRMEAAIWRQGATQALYLDPGISPLSFSPYALETFSFAGEIGIIVTGFDFGSILDVAIEAPCAASIVSSNDEEPTVTYSIGGFHPIALTATFADGTVCTELKQANVGNNTAPEPVITFDGVCVSSAVTFTGESENVVEVVGWNWDLNGTPSTSENPSHAFGVAGTFPVLLRATGSNGCVNFASVDIDIYNKPVAAFDLPTPTVVCTQQQYVFNNTSLFDAASGVTWSWSVNNNPASTSEDLAFTFTSATSFGIKLVASIPGCSSEATSTFNVVHQGPQTSFTFGSVCVNTATQFTGPGTAGASYEWNFGDGGTSTQVSPAHTFTTNAVRNVTLSASNPQGCLNSTTQQVQVYSLPQPAFSLDLPPFSCAGTPSQFHDATPPPGDSNVSQWNWNYGDNGTGTGKDPLHTYTTAGTYNVRLSVTTDKGCTASKDQEVTISPSPTASFISDPTCLNQQTRFTSTSTGNIKSWQWKMGNQVYNIENPTHVYAAMGNSTAQLTVTGTNDCVSTVTKNITVPVVPTPDFKFENACSSQATRFTDLTTSAADPVAQQTWTFNSPGTGSGKEVNFTFANAGTYPVKLDIRNQSGCTYSLSKQVVINPSPVANFNMSIDTGPAPLNVAFTNTSTGAASYQWNFNDGGALKTEANQQYTFNTLGTYSIALNAISTQNCISQITKTVNVIVPYDDLTLEDFTVSQSGSAYRGYVRVTNKGNYRINSFSISYNAGGGILIKENVTATINPGQTSLIQLTNEFTNPASNGYICAELQGDMNILDNKDCATFSESVILAPYPNPTDVYLNVETVLPASAEVRVRMYNTSGASAYDRVFNATSGLSRFSLDVQNLSPGIYVVVITSGGTTTSRRVLVAR